MDTKVLDLIKKVAVQSERRTVGRTTQRELSAHLFISALLKNFNILNTNKRYNTNSTIRARIQDLVSNNTIHTEGQMHAQEFSLEGFTHDLNKEFKLSVK